MKYRKRYGIILMVVVLPLLLLTAAAAQEEESGARKTEAQGPPPALVTVTEIASGAVQPTMEMIGTVYFVRKAKVAAEVEGLVSRVVMTEGRRVEAGGILVNLDTGILDREIAATRAGKEEVAVELAKVRKDLARAKSLYEGGSLPEASYEEHFYRAKRLEKQISGLEAELDRLQLEREKKSIRAPFAGVVMQKKVEKGEWISVGGTVAIVADDSQVDIEIDVPADLLSYLQPDRKIEVVSKGRRFTARYETVIPSGNIATRTFAVKLRLANHAGLMEGMEARARMPVEEKIEGLLVPREAVVENFGRQVVFLVRDGRAKLVPVAVTGYLDRRIGISGPGLEAGQQVIVKGNERLQDGQPVRTGG